MGGGQACSTKLKQPKKARFMVPKVFCFQQGTNIWTSLIMLLSSSIHLLQFSILCLEILNQCNGNEKETTALWVLQPPIIYLMLHTSWSRTNLNHMKKPCKWGSIIVFDSQEYIFPGGVVAHIQMCMNAWLLFATREVELAMAKEIFANYAWYCKFVCSKRTMPPKTWINQESLVNI